MTGAGLLGAGGAGGTAAVVAAVVSAVVIVALLVSLRSVVRQVRELRETVDELRRESRHLLETMEGTVGHAADELARADTLLVTAESVSNRVDSASRLAYLAFSTPVIKVLAFGTGTARAARRLRRRVRD
jgi:hypothetical protein